MDFDGLNTKEGKFYLNHNMVDFLATGNHGRQGKEVDLNLFKQYSNITSKALDILLSPNPEQM
jgi:protein-tyrosine phosphatase